MINKCIFCVKYATHGMRSGVPEVCMDHKIAKMHINLKYKKCVHIECDKSATYAPRGEKELFCKNHATADCIDVVHPICTESGCNNRAHYAAEMWIRAVRCGVHKPDGYINVSNVVCLAENCKNRATHTMKGVRKPICCSVHAPDGFVEACAPKCMYSECDTMPSFAEHKNGIPSFCKKHAPFTYIYVKCKMCAEPYCCRRIRSDMEVCMAHNKKQKL